MLARRLFLYLLHIKRAESKSPWDTKGTTRFVTLWVEGTTPLRAKSLSDMTATIIIEQRISGYVAIPPCLSILINSHSPYHKSTSQYNPIFEKDGEITITVVLSPH